MKYENTGALYLVDASIYVFRSYFSIPDSFVDADGESVNAVYGYTQFLLDLIERQPEHISVAFDESLNTCYRNKIYPAYKANRDLPDKNLEFQFAKCREITGLLGFHYLSLHDYEADDIIGTLMKRFSDNRPTVIVTRDKDLGQLLREGDTLWDFAADQYSDRAAVKNKFGVEAEQMSDYLALAGDSVDNIPGAPGIGAKTAAALLSHFGTLDGLYDSVDQVQSIGIRGAARVLKSLQDNRDRLRMFQQITRIYCDVPMEVSLSELTITPGPLKALLAFCDAMAFGAAIRARIENHSGAHA